MGEDAGQHMCHTSINLAPEECEPRRSFVGEPQGSGALRNATSDHVQASGGR